MHHNYTFLQLLMLQRQKERNIIFICKKRHIIILAFVEPFLAHTRPFNIHLFIIILDKLSDDTKLFVFQLALFPNLCITITCTPRIVHIRL